MTDVLLGMPPLRYRRLGGGYHKEDVEDALETLGETARNAEASLERLRQVSARLGSELQEYRASEERLEAAVRRAEELLFRVEAG